MKKNDKILFVSSEVAPIARTGGLGDVMQALPTALSKKNLDIKVCLPFYKSIDIDRSKLGILPINLSVGLDSKQKKIQFYSYKSISDSPEHIFVKVGDLFERDGLYGNATNGKDYPDNHLRFALFSQAVLEFLKKINWTPSIIHLNDWQTSLIPILLESKYSKDKFFENIKSVLTIHNLGYQGLFDGKLFDSLGLPESYLKPITGALEYYEKVNFLKGGIVSSDRITTVSKTYAVEITGSNEFGCGLEGVLSNLKKPVTGILNGVSYDEWSPKSDKKIPYRYSISNLSGKRMSKVDLLGQAKLPIRNNTPLIGMISRLSDQKGWDLLEEAAEVLFERNLQMIVLGTGDEKYHKMLENLEEKHPDKLKAFLTFDDKLAHTIEAGCDIFLMPSRYEPCGLNQMYSLRYGSVPIVRKVGGLADTVIDYTHNRNDGNGFVFKDYTAVSMLDAIDRAIKLYHSKRKWTKLMKKGMTANLSWEHSALEYIKLYDSMLLS